MSEPLGVQRPPTSRRTATIVSVTFAVGLCLVALVLAVRSLIGVAQQVEAAPPPPSIPATLAEATAEPEPTEPADDEATEPEPTQEPSADDEVAFSSPTGNIGCVLSSAGVRCDIGDRTWDPPSAPGSCDADWGRGLAHGADGTQFTCDSGSVLGAAQVLGYGEILERGDFRCASGQQGMRCTDTSGRGFELARSGYQVL